MKDENDCTSSNIVQRISPIKTTFMCRLKAYPRTTEIYGDPTCSGWGWSGRVWRFVRRH